VFLLEGPPGSGKTTLLRHLAVCFARGEAAACLGWSGPPLLPILVPLRNFGRYLNEHRATCINPAPRALRQFIEDYFAEYELQLPNVNSRTLMYQRCAANVYQKNGRTHCESLS
jgi:energy-coupling factor transporter ATP-binding protein EcfA2